MLKAIIFDMDGVLEDKKYRDKVKRLQRLASELDGPKAVRELLEKEAGKKVS